MWVCEKEKLLDEEEDSVLHVMLPADASGITADCYWLCVVPRCCIASANPVLTRLAARRFEGLMEDMGKLFAVQEAPTHVPPASIAPSFASDKAFATALEAERGAGQSLSPVLRLCHKIQNELLASVGACRAAQPRPTPVSALTPRVQTRSCRRTSRRNWSSLSCTS